ncbi:hypothetical protein [Pelagicoccus sp. SDUM812005]|uniref:DUF4139 domain-containing protein n=1 Tax=Pelagicoccus sp. SDUM812005 TaxID=3041257 RepID=UPI00280CE365|nr:hypothetical protein [Pelagicoccus sp. SDUM812005]MDQ8181914.1 hypothetical protein [Pelagicoccus sp. SDUM812005]
MNITLVSKTRRLVLACLALHLALAASSEDISPSLTIYNGDLAVVRQSFPLNLKKGENELSFSGVTALLDPQSVIISTKDNKHSLAILEQSYRSDIVSPGLLLKQLEGKEVDFLSHDQDGEPKIIRGRLLRSGYTPNSFNQSRHRRYNYNEQNQPIVKVDGKIHFGLPGLPQYGPLPDDSILEPTLNWLISANRSIKAQAELAYLTQGFTWKADYNLSGGNQSDIVDIVGWISMENDSGTSFKDAKIKLIAGDVHQAQHPGEEEIFELSPFEVSGPSNREVEARSFDEYHLYELPRKTTLLDKQSKQIEFLRAEGVKAKTLYIYDGANTTLTPFNHRNLRFNESIPIASSKDVWVVREIENSKLNKLGLPLPAGKTRFYREDTDGQLEFTGENIIDHTPKNEMLRIYTGNGFDLIGERIRTRSDTDRNTFYEEEYTLTLKNRKDSPVTIQAIEHLARWNNWEIQNNTLPFEKIDSNTIVFEVDLDADSERTVTYTVRYTWGSN